AVALGERAQQLHDPRRAEDHERLFACRLGGVLERVHQHRQLTPVVRMKMRQDHVRYLLPRQPELGEAMQRARSTVEHQSQIAARDPVTGTRATRVGCDGAGSDGDELHAHFPRKTMRLNSNIPGALSLARYTPAGNVSPLSARPSHMSLGSQTAPPGEPRP